MSKAFALASLIVGGLIIADLWSHYKTTQAVLNFGSTTEKNLRNR